jgi:probable 2-oxoglutarate dehydrogenase E1 component DHKTD1
MLVDQTTEAVVVPLNAELKSDGKLELANSTLGKGLNSSILDLYTQVL